MEIAPGAFHLNRFLPVGDQRALVDQCRALVDGAVPAYVPVVRGGGKMHVRMLCLGRHWNGQIYKYEAVRSDFDHLPVPPLPDTFKALARDIARSAGMTLDADICILNYYDAEGRMGLHQDEDESERSIANSSNSGLAGATVLRCASASLTRSATMSGCPAAMLCRRRGFQTGDGYSGKRLDVTAVDFTRHPAEIWRQVEALARRMDEMHEVRRNSARAVAGAGGGVSNSGSSVHLGGGRPRL